MVELLVLAAEVARRLDVAAQAQRAPPLGEPGREPQRQVGRLQPSQIGLGHERHCIARTRAPRVHAPPVHHVEPVADLVVGDAPSVELGERRGGFGHDRRDRGVRRQPVADQIEDGAGVRRVVALEEPDDEQLLDFGTARVEKLERARSDVGGLVATKGDVSPALQRDADV